MVASPPNIAKAKQRDEMERNVIEDVIADDQKAHANLPPMMDWGQRAMHGLAERYDS